MKSLAIFVLLLLLLLPAAAHAAGAPSRYFHSGDGTIRLVNARSKAAFAGIYRDASGAYKPEALRRINRAFGAPGTSPTSTVSTRFIEFLDELQDRLAPGETITILSGYRSPSSNTALRAKGRLAAKASLHQYAMAADLKLGSASSESVWNFIKEQGFGGAGFYHGGLVHVDTGPARSWDETTSGVFTDISEENRLIALQSDRDIYLPGEAGTLQFIRMTAFPIGVVPELILERVEGEGEKGGAKRIATLPIAPARVTAGACPQFSTMDEMAGLPWQLPPTTPPGRYRLRARFCEPLWEEMPKEIATPEFEVAAP